MEKINWTIAENEYHLKTPYGMATIIEIRDDIGDKNAIGARYSYAARFEHEDGSIEISDRPLLSFEDAEGWALWGIVMNLDQPKDGEQETNRLLKSLHYSEKYLPDDHKYLHQKRLKWIKQLLRGKRPHLDRVNKSIKQSSSKFKNQWDEMPPLNWLQQGDEYCAQTDFGKAIIQEIRNQDMWIVGRAYSYTPRIENGQKVISKGHEEISFEDAEGWVKSKLYEYNHPLIEDENKLENLQTTIDLCIQVLPEKSDPIHMLRLEWIKDRITVILD